MKDKLKAANIVRGKKGKNLNDFMRVFATKIRGRPRSLCLRRLPDVLALKEEKGSPPPNTTDTVLPLLSERARGGVLCVDGEGAYRGAEKHFDALGLTLEKMSSWQ